MTGQPRRPAPRRATVALARALSKVGLASRSEAIRLVLAGRVRVNDVIVRDPGAAVVPERDRFVLDESPRDAVAWRTILCNKPRGVLTTRRDPEGRRTIFDGLPDELRRLVPVGRLDQATSGLLLLTTDTQLAHWLTDPAHAVPRTYAVTVRGRVTADALVRLREGWSDRGEWLQAADARVRKASGRETHLVVVLTEGRNREVRRLLAQVGHEVTRLVRIAFGGLVLGPLQPGGWRDVTRDEMAEAFPGVPLRGA